MNGEYTGEMTLEGVYTGVYTNTSIPPATMDLGQIDLALHLNQASNTVSGHVMLEQTLVYSPAHTITVTPVGPTPRPRTPTPAPQPLAIGPYVHATFNGMVLRLESDQFSQIVGGLKVTRQFSLLTTAVNGGGNELMGAYRETIWGYTPQPSTVVGTFRLSRPVFGTPIPSINNYRRYLPIVRRAP